MLHGSVAATSWKVSLFLDFADMRLLTFVNILSVVIYNGILEFLKPIKFIYNYKTIIKQFYAEKQFLKTKCKYHIPKNYFLKTMRAPLQNLLTELPLLGKGSSK